MKVPSIVIITGSGYGCWAPLIYDCLFPPLKTNKYCVLVFPGYNLSNMGTVRKVGDTYYIEFFARGLLYSQIAGPDLKAAQELLEKTEATIGAGEALTVVREIDLEAFFTQFLAYASQEFNARSAARFKNAIEHFSRFLKDQYPQAKQLSKVTPRVVEDYKASLDSKNPVLTNFTLLLLREILDHGIKLGFINDNPTLHVRLLPLPPRKRPLTARYKFAQELLSKGVPLSKVFKLLKLSDIAKMMYYANFIPLQREDMYN